MYRQSRHFSGVVRLILVAILTLTFIFPIQATAQQGTQPTLQITRIDTSEFPLVRIYVYGSGVSGNLSSLPVTLRENGATRPVISNETQAVGTQVALLLDSARSIVRPGSTGDAQYIEAGLAARRLVSESNSRNWLSPQIDWLTSIAFGSSAVPKTLRPWTRDHQAAADSLYTFDPQQENLSESTPLFDLLFFTARSFADNSPPETAGKTRSMVVFSDGFDRVSTTQLTDLALASAQPIPVHTVLLGPDIPAQRQNLERISLLTGGTFVHLRNGLPDVDPIWQAIANTRNQQVFTYRSQTALPRDVSVSIRLSDGRNIAATAPLPSVAVQPVQVVVQDPIPSQEFQRTAAQYDTPLDDVEPKEIQIQAFFEWPDEFPRELVKVEYEVAGAGMFERTEPPFDEPLAFSIGTLDTGTYSLRIRATDELGLVGESNPIPFSVLVNRPAPPTATPNATATREAQLVATATSEAMAAARATSEARAAAAEATASAAALAAEQGNAEAKATSAAIQATADANRADAQATTQVLSLAQDAASTREAVAIATAGAANATATASAEEARATAIAQEGVIAVTTERVRTLGWVSIASSLLAVAALALAIYVLSNRDRRRRATEIVTGTVKAVTQPFVRTRKGKSVARLVLVDNAGTPGLQNSIPLREHSSLRIGRDPELVNVALEDRRVSRLHCRITDDNGGFRVLDEGSTTGTFVNEEEVDMHGHLLKPGDVIGIGPIEYRFENDDPSKTKPSGKPEVSGTEPYQRAVKSR